MDAIVHVFGWVTDNSPHQIILGISGGTVYTVLYQKSVYDVLTFLQKMNMVVLRLT